MHDPTGYSMPRERGGSWPKPDFRTIRGGASDRIHGDGETLACPVISEWILTSRTLRTDVPPHMVRAEELVDFWADEQMAEEQAAPGG